MTAARPATAAATLLATILLAAGCGSTAPAAPPAQSAAPPASASLATSTATATGTWAVTVMGGFASQHNNFWQLFVRPAGSTRWKLVTPPGTADNGGLVLAGAGSSLITGFRPSQYLTFSPLSATSDGQAWASDNPLDAPLARVPDALAAAPASHDLLALTSRGTVLQAAPAYTSWSTLTTRRSLASTPAGLHCDLRNLTAAAYTASGVPLLAGACTRPGVVGIFTRTAGAWQATGPALAGAPARQPVTVLRLTRTATGLTALLSAGTGPGASLIAAWSADNGSSWTVSAPLPLNRAKLTATAFGPTGETAVVLNGHQGEAVSPGSEAAWQQLPALPRGTATLALGPQGNLDALAVDRTVLTIWQLDPGSAAWHATQAINVPIQFGTSG